MEGTAVESVCISAYPTEQFIPQRNNIVDSNEKLIAEVGPTRNSASQCTYKGLNRDSGAGANAGSRTEITFVTNNPISELVWSPNNGLSPKCADFSLPEKRLSLLWSKESGNMEISPPHSLEGNKSDEHGNEAEGNMSSMRSADSAPNEISKKVTSALFPTTTAGITTFCHTSHSQHLRTCGDMEVSRMGMEVAVLDVNQSAKKETDACRLGEAGTLKFDIGKDGTEILSTLPDKASIPDNGKSADSLQFKPPEHPIDLAPGQFKHGDSKGASSDCLVGNGDIGSGNIHCVGPTHMLGSEVSTVKKHSRPKSPMTISDGKKTNSVLAAIENKRTEMENLKFMKLSAPDKPESTAENDVHPSEMIAENRVALPEFNMIAIASHQKDKGKNILKKNPWISRLCNEITPLEASSYGNGIPSNRREGKEKVLSAMEVTQALSKEGDVSHESVESSNSGGLFSLGKRAWCFEQQLHITSKKVKNQRKDTQCSASFFRQDSSFVNYISNMIKGSSKFDPDETPLEITGRPTHHRSKSYDSLVISHDKNQDPDRKPTGFQNIFRALYCSSLRAQDKKNCNLNNQIDLESPKALEMENKTLCHLGNAHVSSDGEKDVKMLELVPMLNPGVCQVGESHSTRPGMALANITGVEENTKNEHWENCNSCNVACFVEFGGVHTSGSSFQKNSISPPECKLATKHDFVDQNKSANSVTNRSNLLESLWITRFSPKVSVPPMNSVQCSLDMLPATEASTDCHRFLPHSQNILSTANGSNNVLDGHETSAKDELNDGSRNIQNYSVGPTASCDSKRSKVPADPKFKSKLSPILPSEKFKNSEAMASVFARRLDALKHIIPSKAADSETCMTTICFFCGITGHSLRNCSEVVESDLDDLLKNINLYDGAEESSSLCIRCLELNHWAIACPYASLKKQTARDGYACLDGKSQPLGGASTVSQWESSRAENEHEVHTDVHDKLTRTMILNGRVSDREPAKKNVKGKDDQCGVNTSGELILNGKHASSSSEENGLKENQTSPFSYVNRQIPNVPNGTFEAIRRLRLSRSDILKWMKSPVQNFPIEGFFLRLRLGKWEEGLGGTGYHVACISGGSQERSCGTCRAPISVDIGGLKCLVDCRYVSNHDFVEDELMAWWCATLRSNSKLPSDEDLKIKLLERERYGF